MGNKVDLCDPGHDAEHSTDSAEHLRTGTESASGLSKTSRRQVSVEEAELFAKEEGLLFVESSAKSGFNVDQAFEQAARDILEKIHRGAFDDDQVRILFS